jgi:undecaprenyl-diphosphatase
MSIPRRRTLVVIAVVAVLAFVLFGLLATLPWPALRQLDALAPSVGHAVAARDPWLRLPVLVVTDLGSPAVVDVVTVLVAGVLLLRRRWRPAVVVAVARFGELACEATAKALVGRPRPGLTPLLTSASGGSFPSGHSAGSAAAYGAIGLVLAASLGRPAARWVLAVAALLVLAVAASRVVLGVHYPTDVLGGLALGTAWWAAAFAAFRPGESGLDLDAEPPAAARRIA